MEQRVINSAYIVFVLNPLCIVFQQSGNLALRASIRQQKELRSLNGACPVEEMMIINDPDHFLQGIPHGPDQSLYLHSGFCLRSALSFHIVLCMQTPSTFLHRGGKIILPPTVLHQIIKQRTRTFI